MYSSISYARRQMRLGTSNTWSYFYGRIVVKFASNVVAWLVITSFDIMLALVDHGSWRHDEFGLVLSRK